MILIADSGATKTAWRLIDREKQILQFKSDGLHPLFCDEKKVMDVLWDQLLQQPNFPDAKWIEEIYFYGAGCSTADRCEIIHKGLGGVFEKAKIEVESDLLGAARGLCGHREGIVAILGTGSASGYFDGNLIIQSRPSLGYILGDEGSGAYIGRLLLRDFLYSDMPKDLWEKFRQQYQLDKDKIISKLYRNDFPNRYLASFSPFIFRHIKEAYCAQLVQHAFDAFMNKHIVYYPIKESELYATGSIAFYYHNILRHSAEGKGVIVNTIVEDPAAGLGLYHLGEI